MRRLGTVRAVVGIAVSSLVPGIGPVLGTAPVAAAPCTTTLSSGTVSGFTVPAGQTWCFNPSVSTTITSTGNVIVNGALQMRPASASVVHTLRFTGFTENQFQGGGNDPLPTDIGLWVTGAGSLDLAGSAKTSWTRLAGSAAVGARQLALRTAVSGWAIGDEVMIAPTGAATSPAAHTEFETRSLTSATTTSVGWASGLTYAHPQVNTWTAEIANLTRNVRIEGQDATHRTHIFIRSSVPQSIRNVAIRYTGPRQDLQQDGKTEIVLGRYGLHFHRAGDGSTGSLVEGVVIRDSGSHAFVPHASNGITFRDTVSYNTMEDPYWYDPEVFQSTTPPVEAPNNTTFDRAFAGRVTKDPKNGGHRLSGFWLGAGVGNSVRNSAVVGVMGGQNSSGYHWPENKAGIWLFEDNMAHNNVRDGIFTWQNNRGSHVITRFTGYHNGYAGIEHGAYTNAYRFENSSLWGNGQGNIVLHAESSESPLMTFSGITLDGAGITPYGYYLRTPASSSAVAGSPARVCANTIRGHTGTNYYISYTGADSTVAARLSILSSAC